MDEGILLWAMFNPGAKGSLFVARALEDTAGRFALTISGQAHVGATCGTYCDETELSEDGLTRAAQHWLEIFSDEGWIAADALAATSGAKNRA